jgi:cytochrome c556
MPMTIRALALIISAVATVVPTAALVGRVDGAAHAFANTQNETHARPEAVVDNGEFMDMFLKATYTELQQTMAKPPADRKEWAAIYQKATRLAEMQNLLFFRNRDEVKDPRWAEHTAAGRQAAADLATAAVVALRNVQKADYEGVRKKYVALADSCNACHKTFARDAPTIKP